MRAVQVTETTGPDALQVVELEEPVPDDGQLLVDVKAAGISFPDLLLSRGQYQLKPELPFTLGEELAGVVHKAPSGSKFSEGDRVVGYAIGGAFSEAALAVPLTTFRLPDELDFAEGAGYLLNYHTAHFGLIRRAALKEGETLLVHGAAGGTGTAAIQIGKATGARVVAVVSSDEKEEIARRAGADEVVRSDGDWRKEAGPANVIFDPVGGSRFDESVRALAPEGRLLVIGFTEGAIPSVAVNRLLFRNVSVVGAGWGHFALERPDYLDETAADLDRMVREGFVRPLVGARYSLDQIPQALHDLEGRRAVGKLVLDLEAGG